MPPRTWTSAGLSWGQHRGSSQGGIGGFSLGIDSGSGVMAGNVNDTMILGGTSFGGGATAVLEAGELDTSDRLWLDPVMYDEDEDDDEDDDSFDGDEFDDDDEFEEEDDDFLEDDEEEEDDSEDVDGDDEDDDDF
ncbi:MAG: hypothetical protein AB7Q00_03955 [Phycisphaerales bacterium]